LYQTLRDMLLRLGIEVESWSENQQASLKVALTVYAAAPSDLALARSKQLYHDKIDAGAVDDETNTEPTTLPITLGTGHPDLRTA
jgi:hypothetical protein